MTSCTTSPWASCTLGDQSAMRHNYQRRVDPLHSRPEIASPGPCSLPLSFLLRCHPHSTEVFYLASSTSGSRKEGDITTMATATKCETPQSEEVRLIKTAFPNGCRIIKDIGMLTHVVTVQPADMDVVLKFQLTGSYPSVIPEIAVRSESLSEEDGDELKCHLSTEAAKLLNQPMIRTLVTFAEEWLRSHGVHPGKSVKASTDVVLDNKKKQKKKRSKKTKSEDEEEDKKIPSMKTAEDVIKRILWDDKLDKDDFLVGYLDRFKGIVEKYFSAFSWEDIATVDYDVLAVPKHRIQYFKYREEKIWDKPSRLDNVFGSRGSGITIYDVIERYQPPSQQSEVSSVPDQPQESNGTAVGEQNNSEDYDSEDDDSDDGIIVTIGASVNTGYTGTQNQLEFGPDADEEKHSYWEDKLRPNYFLAVRITDGDILQAVEQVQDYLLDNEPVLGPCCIPPKALHITLCTLGLDTAEQINHAAEVLKNIQPEIASSLPKEPLRLDGVSNFFNRVVYAKVHYQQDFIKFVDHLKLLLRESGVEIRDNYEFVPHMTIMKVSRPVARIRGSKNIDPWLYSNFSDFLFGQQVVDGVYLCSMGDERRPDGFYVCPAEIHFR